MEELAEDRELLKELFESAEHRRLSIRYNALYALSVGFSVAQVSKIFCKDEDTIRAWIKKWMKQKSVIDRERSGAPAKVSEKTEAKIARLVDENNPRKHGMNCSFWDCRELQKYFLMRGTILSRESIRIVLKKNGFRYVKAEYEYALADEAKKTLFLQEFGQFLQTREKGTTVLFGDEMTSALHPKNGYTWTRKEKAVVRTFSSHKKVSVIGAISPLTGAKEIMLSKRINANAFIRFLGRLLRRFRGDVVFFLDNFPSHKAKKVQEFLQSRKRLRLVHLPEYSPDLNIAEYLWNYTRRKFLNNRVFRNIRQLIPSAAAFFRRLTKAEIRRICNTDILLHRIT